MGNENSAPSKSKLGGKKPESKSHTKSNEHKGSKLEFNAENSPISPLSKISGTSPVVDEGGSLSIPNSAGGRLQSSACSEAQFAFMDNELEEIDLKPVRQSSLRCQPSKEIKLRPISKSERWVKVAIKQKPNKKSGKEEVIYAKDIDIPEGEPGVGRSGSAAGVVVQSHLRRVRVKKKKKNGKGKIKKPRSRQRRYGHVMSQSHDNDEYLLSLGMMVGLRVAVGRQENPSEKQDLSVSDFYQVDNYVFPPAGGKGVLVTPAHNLGHTFKFKEYAPKIFKRIRSHFGIQKMTYMLSVAGNCEFLEFFSNAKSGEFFFYSHDEKFMIKTMKKAETRFLRRILPFYYEHIRKRPDTLLVRFCGMYRVKMHHINRKVHFMVMHSVFDTPREMHCIYDLKGSTIGRQKKEGQMVGKDLDLVESGTKLNLGRQKDVFLRIIKQDAEFLSKMNIMDYSLLLGIHDRSKPQSLAVSTRDYHDNYVNDNDDGDKQTALHRRHSSYGLLRVNMLENDDEEDESDHEENKPAPFLGTLAYKGFSKRIKEPEDQNKSNESGAEYSSESEYDSDDDDDLDFNAMGQNYDDLPRVSQMSIFHSQQNSIEGREQATARTGSNSTIDDTPRRSKISDAKQSSRDQSTVRLYRKRDLGIPSDVNDDRSSFHGREIYYMGIIDILQEYNMKKHAETAVKSSIMRQSREDISCVDPALYAKRFLNFIRDQTE